MTAYGWFLGLISAGPVLTLVVPAWRRYFPDVRGLVFVWLFVSTPWLLLDVWQHAAGFWHYNPQFVSTLLVINVPLEEGLFFYLVPLACLTVWQMVCRHRLMVLAWPGYLVVMSLFLLGFVMIGIYGIFMPFRSLIDLVAMVVAYGLLWFFMRHHGGRGMILSWTAVVGVLFMISNTVLTALPIVEYNDTVMVPWRIGTIPVSDVYYNFGFLWLVLLVYLGTQRITLNQLRQK